MKKLSLLMLTMTLSLLTSATGLYAQSSDVIDHITDLGKVEKVRGVITNMTATEVTITVNTLGRKHEVNKITQIDLGDSPLPLEMALKLLK
ncbi:MAG: hypothetical protein VB857_02385, partial [Pirellulaceae bacterium]